VIAKIAVAGDCTWKKRGLCNLSGVTTLTKFRIWKVFDTHVRSTQRSSFGKECSWWEEHTQNDFDEFCERLDRHKYFGLATHEGSAGAMEGRGIRHIFKRSEKKSIK